MIQLLSTTNKYITNDKYNDTYKHIHYTNNPALNVNKVTNKMLVHNHELFFKWITDLYLSAK